MNRKTMTAAALLAILAFVVGSFTLNRVSHDDKPAASSTGAGSNSVGGSDKGNGKRSASSDDDTAPSTGVTNGDGSEVIKQPEGSGSDKLPGLSRKKSSAATAPLVTGRMPKTASSTGTIVAGFPVTVIPVGDASAVQTSGVSVEGRRLQVSVEADDSRSPNKVLAFYRSALTEKGFRESTSPAVGGSTAASFTRGDDNLVLTVTPRRSKGTSFTVFGTLHAAKG